MKVEHEGDTAAWLVGTLTVASVQDTDCLHRRSYGLIRLFFETPVAGDQKASLSFMPLLLQSRSTCFWF